MTILFYILTLILSIILIVVWYNYMRIPPMNCLNIVTGGVKTGKSTLSVYLSIKEWKRRCRITKIKNYFRWLFRKEPLEMPLLYSNIPLSVPYVPMTNDLLLRNTRFVYGSVVYLGEVSLISNSMNYSNDINNEKQLLLYKLFGHSTRGGIAFIDTQCVADSFYGLKRSLNSNIYIHKCFKYFPFLLFMQYSIERYSEDNQSVNVYTDKTINDLKWLCVPKRVWKCFDAYCYSFLTDKCPVEEKINTNGVNQPFEIVSFNKYKTLYKEDTNNEKKNNW